ncbi:MAG: hypothetical protein Q4B63_03455 [Clostridium perfringens]|nr:hypothetical protein [Clostridium perfringens]
MEKIEMMVGYDMNFYEQKFNDNSKKVATYLYNFLKKTIGNKVHGISINENLLKVWSYYFINIIEESPGEGRKILVNLINHFIKMMADKESIKINGDADGKLVLDPSFCRIWFGTSLNIMLAFQYGKDGYKKAFESIQKEFLNNDSKIKTLVIA